MKIFIPRHIEGGIFNMNIQVGPFTVTMVQLFILATGLGLSMAIWKQLVDSGVDKIVAIILIAPVMIVFALIAFFKYTELKLVPFVAKLITTYFLDETKKFQLNFEKTDPVNIKIKILKSMEPQQIIEAKKNNIEKDKLENLETFI